MEFGTNKRHSMKILHLSTSDVGGAGIAASRIHLAMKKSQLDSNMLVLYKQGDDPDIQCVKGLGKLYPRLGEELRKRIDKRVRSEYGMFSYAKYGMDVTDYDVFNQADIIYIHWVHGSSFLSLSNIDQILKTKKQIVIFLHDMWYITGGCHYSFDCNKYQTECNHCQMLTTNKYKDISYKQFKKKAHIFAKYDNLSFVTASKWMTECVKKSALATNKKVACIPYPLNLSIFKPHDKQFSRTIFNLPPDKKIVCFGAILAISNSYKGWSYLEIALKKLKERDINDIEVLIFGSCFNQAIVDQIPFPVHFSGHLHDAYSLSLIYNAVDVYVTPTLAEAFGQTCLESMACGTPVVGFNVGGIPDMIEHKKNGYLARYKDSDDLANGIEYVLDSDNYKDLSKQAVRKVHDLSSESVITELHLKFL
jgi:glycosyltransferase involved in cell wall biosynthesis